MKKQQQLNRHLTNRIIKPLIILLLLALFIIAGAYWILGAQTKQPQIRESEVGVVPTVSYVTEPTIVEEGCRNTALGIEFTYVPEGWRCESEVYPKTQFSDAWGAITVSTLFDRTIIIGGGGRGFPCVTDEKPDLSICQKMVFYQSDKALIYQYASTIGGELDNEIFGFVNKEGGKLGVKGPSFSLRYGRRPLSSSEKQEVIQFLDSLIFIN